MIDFAEQLAALKNSDLFDLEWYRKKYEIDSDDDEWIYEQYLLSADNFSRKTSRHFDGAQYLSRHPDVGSSGVNPLVHYLGWGIFEGRGDLEFADPEFREKRISRREMLLPGSPCASIIITNSNGSEHLHELFASLRLQTYQNFEIIFVDDFSSDESIEIAKSYSIDKIVDLSNLFDERVGFAGANNVGLDYVSGDIVVLQNNDTKLDQNWLEGLVRGLQDDPYTAAACPKIRFYTKFFRLRLEAAAEFSYALTESLQSLSYRKYNVPVGNEIGGAVDAVDDGSGKFRCVVDISSEFDEFSVRVFNHTSEVSVSLGSEDDHFCEERVSTQKDCCRLRKGRGDDRFAFYLINNVGGYQQADGTPGDRGIFHIDKGQFNSREHVPYFCGCSVAIKKDALFGDKLFYDSFVAYYEDSDLSKRLTSYGYNILYAPDSIVYHKHSSSNIEKSSFWRTYTFRNRYLFKFLWSSASERNLVAKELFLELNHLKTYYSSQLQLSDSESGFLANIPFIAQSAECFFRRASSHNMLKRDKKRIGLFNRFWDTLGGGEAHAMHVASILSQRGEIELIGTSDFHLSKIGKYFNVDISGWRKRIVKDITPSITEEYDIFVNSCYQDQTVSRADISLYLVSFPSSGKVPIEFLKSYYFLANSRFTMQWMEKYWGKGRFMGTVFFPAVPSEFLYSKKRNTKSRKILSVGRFVTSGHTKGQMEIATAYKKIVSASPELSDWELILIGSANDPSYVSDVRRFVKELNVKIITDADFKTVLDYYLASQIYVHASGLHRDEYRHPELFEHFGMAVAQAVSAGCTPLVYKAAGPVEILEEMKIGHSFIDENHLAKSLEKLMRESNLCRVNDAKVKLCEKKFGFERARSHLSDIVECLSNGVPI